VISGHWSKQYPGAPLSEGIHGFTASVSDGAGGSYTAVFTVTIDLDGDDDDIPDAVEGATDSDGDGVPDYLDTDSDYDGIADADEDTGLPVLSGDDSDGDGIDDAVDVDNTGGTDANGNGIDDALEPSDQDADGLPDYLDADTDNDGIPNIIEGNIDTDLDGIPDHRDVDSDADGISDQLEQTLMPPLSGTDGPLGPGFVRFFEENSIRYFRRTRHWWNLNNVDGRILTAILVMRPGRRKSDQKPMRNRSAFERFGARRRERVTTNSCCLRRRFSAMTGFVPPGPRDFAIVVSRCTSRMTMSFIV